MTKRAWSVATVLALACAPAPAAHAAAPNWSTRTLSWGTNTYGQLGDASDETRTTPVPVRSVLARFTQVAAGYEHTVALAKDGTVWAWGRNDDGQVGDHAADPVRTPARVPGLTGVTQVAAGWSGSLALRSDGTVWAWGVYPFLGDGTQASRGVPAPVPGLTGVVEIAAKGSHVLARRTDSTVWGWGRNAEGQLGDGTFTRRLSPVRVPSLGGVVSIAVSKYHSLAAREDGSVWAWGNSTYGWDGSSYGGELRTPVQVTGAPKIVKVAAGYDHSLALDASGRLWAWGRNDKGQRGDGTLTTPHNPGAPRPVPALTQVTAITAGRRTSAALSGGNVYTWGGNSAGQMGDGNAPAARPTPAIVPGVGPAIGVTAGMGDGHLLAVQADPPPAPPGATLTVQPESVTVNAGRSATATVLVEPINGLTESLKLTAAGLPSGVTVTFDPPLVPPGQTSVMTVTAGPDAPIRSETVTVHGYDSSRTSLASTTFDLTVSGPIE
ncbi:hypothetical protein Acor_44450 [Acrocarpospora corrugata]|uniref:RCC1-like domain-containing protein n=1 Tax=Acrocarpospora corrugata TaxID=35763 RepID=A0A5M3W263_9ACTN|nr:hypothetical protein [Acrocarpospora corrugata]GES02379.1 hypothetical protein Acor_44450 [Acrocarpospora corrugata]